MKQLTRRVPVRRDLDVLAAPDVQQSIQPSLAAGGSSAVRPRPAVEAAAHPAHPAHPAHSGHRGIEALRELALVAALFTIYEVGRYVAGGHVGRAFTNAAEVWHVERWLHLPDESTLQAPFLVHGDLAHAANVFYASVHFPATITALVLLWWFRPDDYRWTRTVMALLTFSSLVIHIGFPLAPPRMLPGDGMVDLGQLFGPSVYASASTNGFADQFAAMPSLHVGWAVLVAVAGIRALRSRWRWLLVLHPLLTLGVVVVTGNHYWLDGATSVVLLTVAVTAVAFSRLQGAGGRVSTSVSTGFSTAPSGSGGHDRWADLGAQHARSVGDTTRARQP